MGFDFNDITTMNYNTFSDTLITTATDNTVGIALDVTQIPYNAGKDYLFIYAHFVTLY